MSVILLTVVVQNDTQQNDSAAAIAECHSVDCCCADCHGAVLMELSYRTN